MLPFDIHDAAMDPMKAKALKEAEQGGKFAWGTAYNGHFDQSGHFKGRVAVRGKQYPIDCISTMDHSWGPRPERGAPNMSWLHAHFSRDLAFHVIFSFDPKTNGRELSLAHGYVVEKGEIFGLKEARGTTKRVRERYADTVELVLVDSARPRMEAQCEGHDHLSLAVLAQHGFVQCARPLAVRKSYRVRRNSGFFRDAAANRAQC